MLSLGTSSTSALPAPVLEQIRNLLEAVFGPDFSDDDWNHTLGGMHVWLADPSRLLSHAALVERTLVCSGHTLRAGYVEAVATTPEHQCKGHGTAVMKRVGELICERYALGALSSNAPEFYARLGWETWRGPTFVDGPRGRERTVDDDGGVMILRTPHSPHLDLDGEIVCDWRVGDVW